MKQLLKFPLVILLIALLASCSEEESKPKYTSIEGKWSFKSATTQGEFTVNADMTVNNGNFKVGAEQATIIKSLQTTNTSISLGGPSSKVLVILQYKANSSYTELTAESMEYQNKLIKEPVKVTRVN